MTGVIGDEGKLAQHDRPTVVEIVVAAQFGALPRLEPHDVVRVNQRILDYHLAEPGQS